MTNQDQLDNFMRMLSVQCGREMGDDDPNFPGILRNAWETYFHLCFLSNGELYRDFETIFNPIYGRDHEIKVAVLKVLANCPRTGTELAEELGAGRNGRFSQLLKDLEEGGFITPDQGMNPETGAETRIAKYRLRDTIRGSISNMSFRTRKRSVEVLLSVFRSSSCRRGRWSGGCNSRI